MLILPAVLALALVLSNIPSHASLNDLLEKERRIAKVPGLSAAVVKFGQVEYAGGAGFSDLENKVPAAADTVYRLGSVTKQFTATMIMQLVHEGKLSLDTTLGSVLPTSPTQWQRVTMRQLLTHTAGIPSYTDVPNFILLIRGTVTPAHINDNVAKRPLDFEPGSNWHYSNSGYILLGLIVEKLDARTYDASLHARILTPLGMNETYFSAQDMIVDHRAHGYSTAGGKVVNCAFIDMVWPFSAGAMESTVRDLAKWDAALYGNKILDQKSLQEMWTPVKLSAGAVEPYGFGWQLYDVNKIPIVAHGGGIPGFSTFIERVPSLGLSVVVLTNSDEANGQAIAEHIAAFVEPNLQKLVVKIEDRVPAATESVRQALLDLSAGKVNSQLFAQNMISLLTPEKLAQMKTASDSYGPLISLTLIKSESSNGKLSRSYLVHFKNADFTGDFVFEKHGLIEGALLHP